MKHPGRPYEEWSDEELLRSWKRCLTKLDRWKKRGIGQKTIAKQVQIDPARITEFRKAPPKPNQPTMCAILGYLLRSGGPQRFDWDKWHEKRKPTDGFDPVEAVYHHHTLECNALQDWLLLDVQVDKLEVLFGQSVYAPERRKTRMIQNFMYQLLDHVDHVREHEEEVWDEFQRKMIFDIVNCTLLGDKEKGLESLREQAWRSAQPDDENLAFPMILILEACLYIHHGLNFSERTLIRKGIDLMPLAISKPNKDRVVYMGNTWLALDRLVREDHELTGRFAKALESIEEEDVLEDFGKARVQDCVDVPTAEKFLEEKHASFWKRLARPSRVLGCILLQFTAGPIVTAALLAVGSGT